MKPAIYEKRIGFAPRLGASLIDGIITTTLIVVVFFVVLNLSGFFDEVRAMGASGGPPDSNKSFESFFGKILTAIQVGLLVSVGYDMIELFTGASPGKHLLGMKVGNKDGSPADLPKYAFRRVLKSAPLLLSLIAFQFFEFDVDKLSQAQPNSTNPFAAMDTFGAGYFFINSLNQILQLLFLVSCLFALADHRMALHDMAAGTAIFKKKDLREYDPNAEEEVI